VKKILIFIIVFLAASSLEASLPKDPKEQARLGLELLLKRDYVAAKTFIDQIMESENGRLLGIFGKMTLSQIRNFENFDFRFDRDFEKYAKEASMRATAILNDPHAPPWDLEIAGAVFGIIGFQKAHNRRWFSALLDARHAISAMERVIQIDPKIGDPYLGIGLYHYWRSYYTRILKFLPFYDDRRDEGRKMMRRSYKTGEFVPPLSEISLAFLDFHEEKYERVVQVTDRFLSRFPKNVIVRTLKGKALWKLKKFDEGRAEFLKVFEMDKALTKNKLFLALSYTSEGEDKREGRRLLKEYLAVEKKPSHHWRKLAKEVRAKLED
jgi:tetratricopeptide (TPR) repeat protein